MRQQRILEILACNPCGDVVFQPAEISFVDLSRLLSWTGQMLILTYAGLFGGLWYTCTANIILFSAQV